MAAEAAGVGNECEECEKFVSVNGSEAQLFFLFFDVDAAKSREKKPERMRKRVQVFLGWENSNDFFYMLMFCFHRFHYLLSSVVVWNLDYIFFLTSACFCCPFHSHRRI